MRTPGRCTNFESCWMANGKRDVRVLVGHAFVCPACGSALQAPPLQAISANSMTGALAASVLLVATAGGAGFGVVRLAQTASTATVAMLHPKAVPATMVAQKAAPPAGLAQQDAGPGTRVLGDVRIAANPPRNYTSLRLGDGIPTLDLSPSVPAAVYVAAAAPHPLVLPISFGRPQPPEDDAPAQSSHWHHRGVWHATYGTDTATAAPVARPGLPAAAAGTQAASADDAAGFRQAQLGVPPSQGDGEADMAEAPPAQASIMPVQQASFRVPDAGESSAASAESGEPPAALTRLIVPAVDREPTLSGSQDVTPEDASAYVPDERVPQYQPAARRRIRSPLQ